MSFTDPFEPSAYSYEPNPLVEHASVNDSALPNDSMNVEASLPAPDAQATPSLPEHPAGSLKRKAEGEPTVEAQPQQPNKKFKFSLGASGAAPAPPASPAPAPSLGNTPASTLATPSAPKPVSTTAATIQNAANDADAAREALLRELEALDQQLLELDRQMTAPVRSVPPPSLGYPVSRSHRSASRRTYDEIDDLGVRPSHHRSSIRSQTYAGPGRPVPPSTPKRKSYEPALPAPQWMRGPRVSSRGNEAKAWEEAKALLRDITNHQWAWPFKEPVDPIKLGIPNYHKVITHPMDLGTVRKRMTNKFYGKVQNFVDDMRLIWSNCMTFNAPVTDVYKMAQTLSEICEARFPKILELAKPNPREELRRARETLIKTEAQRRELEEEESKLRAEVEAARQEPEVNFVMPPLVENPAPLTYEERTHLYNNINNLNEQQQYGLIALIKETHPQLIEAQTVELTLDTDHLDNALLRRMELFISQNGLATAQPHVKPEAPPTLDESAGLPPSNAPTSQESVGPEKNDMSESSSSSDDEVPFAPPTASLPAIMPSSDVPDLTPLESMENKVPRPIIDAKSTEAGEEVQVEATWTNLDEEKPQEEEKQGEEKLEGGNDPLWSEFKARTAQQLQLEKEKEEREQALKLAQMEKLEEERRQALEAKAEEEARKEREEQEELERKREEARLQREQAAPQVNLLEQSAIMKEFEQSLNTQ